MVTGVSVQAHGVCGDECVSCADVCVCVRYCWRICVCVSESMTWHGDEFRTMTVSQVGSVS